MATARCVRRTAAAAAGAVSIAAGGSAVADVAMFSPSRDTTLYQDATGTLSNGAGQHFFAGTTGGGVARRGLVAFDLSGVPAGATVTGVTLMLAMSRGGPELVPVSLHRVLADWGEGTTDADGNEGGGGPVTAGSATWVHRFHDSVLWAAAGGDFAPGASATTTVGDLGSYAWSAPGMIADVQAWVDGGAANHGWLLLADESVTSTAKRFDSRENPLESARPRLVVEYVPGPGAGALVTLGTIAGLRRRRR